MHKRHGLRVTKGGSLVLARLLSIFKGGGEAMIACLPSFGEILFYGGDGVSVNWENVIRGAF